MPNFAKLSTEDFDRLLAEVIDAENTKPSDLLTVPGIYETLSEHYNNAVLDAWELEQAEKDPEA